MILGLDLSLAATGYACPVCGTGTIKTKKQDNRMARCDLIARTCMDHLMHPEARVELVLVEGYTFATTHNAHLGAELGGIVRWMLNDIVTWRDVAPATLKKFTTGKGNANKDMMIAEAIRRFGFQGYDNNEADAYMLREMGLTHYGQVERELPKVHLEALDKVDWPELVVA